MTCSETLSLKIENPAIAESSDTIVCADDSSDCLLTPFTIALTGNFKDPSNPNRTHGSLGTLIERHGGVFSPLVRKTTNIVISTQASFDGETSKIKIARLKKVPIVSLEWLSDTLDAGEVKPPQDYVYKNPTKPGSSKSSNSELRRSLARKGFFTSGKNITDRFQINLTMNDKVFLEANITYVQDVENQDTVPMKIFPREGATNASSYYQILKTIKEKDKGNRSRCQWLRDVFYYKGFLCLVKDEPFQITGCERPVALSTVLRKSIGRFVDTEVQRFARELFKSVAFLHTLEIVHTRLEPSNLFLYPVSDDNQRSAVSLLKSPIRVGGLESATFEKKKDDYGNFVHHPSFIPNRYASPEMIEERCSSSSDIWSIGCIIFEIVTGVPFVIELQGREPIIGDDKDAKGGFGDLIRERLEYKTEKKSRCMRSYKDLLGDSECTKECAHLLESIFKLHGRPTAEEALEHRWLKLA